MNDLISRQAAIDAVTKAWTKYMPMDIDISGSFVLGTLMELPSAQPEIIRCKDCKWQDMGECEHKLALVVANDNNFCSYAERREE